MGRVTTIAGVALAAWTVTDVASSQTPSAGPAVFANDPAAVAEPDDSLSQATPIAPGVVYQATIDKPYDTDWFSVTVLAGRYAAVEMAVGAAGCSEALTTTDAEGDSTGLKREGESGVVLRLDAYDSNTALGFNVTGGCQGLTYQVRVTPPDAITLPAPPVVTRTASLSLQRRGKTYRGKIISSDGACVKRRTVQLRKRGRGSHVFARATTGDDGSFRLVRHVRLGGRLYAYAPSSHDGEQNCGTLRSAVIKG